MELITIENSNYWRSKDKRARVVARWNLKKDQHCSKNRIRNGNFEIIEVKEWWTSCWNWKALRVSWGLQKYPWKKRYWTEILNWEGKCSKFWDWFSKIAKWLKCRKS